MSRRIRTRESDAGVAEFRTLGDMYGFVGAQFGSFFEGPGKVMGLAPRHAGDSRRVLPDHASGSSIRGGERPLPHDEHCPARQADH
jgi:hypothetical protein